MVLIITTLLYPAELYLQHLSTCRNSESLGLQRLISLTSWGLFQSLSSWKNIMINLWGSTVADSHYFVKIFFKMDSYNWTPYMRYSLNSTEQNKALVTFNLNLYYLLKLYVTCTYIFWLHLLFYSTWKKIYNWNLNCCPARTSHICIWAFKIERHNFISFNIHFVSFVVAILSKSFWISILSNCTLTIHYPSVCQTNLTNIPSTHMPSPNSI